MTTAGSRPEYDDPPVVEVVFGAGLEPTPLSVVDLSTLAVEGFGDAFPIRLEQPPVGIVHETFSDMPLGLSLAMQAGQAPLRLWLQSTDQTQLIQLQRDWLACNWQKAGGVGPYPRYDAIEAFFLSTWDALGRFTEDRYFRPLQPVQCELSYLNHIEPGVVWQRQGQIAEVLALVGSPGEFLPEAEDARIAVRYRITHQGRDVGRLHVEAGPAVRAVDGTPIIQLNLTARGAPLGHGRDGMVAFFRLAHDWIVRGFAAVATDAAQDTMWGRHR